MLLPHFLHHFWRKIFILLYSINWPNFIAWFPLLCEILSSIFIVIICWCHKCWSYLIFLIKPLFLHDQKVKKKTYLQTYLFCKNLFTKKYLSFYILLTDQLLLCCSLYFVRYWTIYLLQLFVDVINVEITLYF